MASSFGQYTSGINPVQGIAQTGSVIAEMQLKAWDTVGKQFSTAIEEYAKQESYRKMQEAIANSAGTKDIAERLKGYVQDIDPTKTAFKSVDDAWTKYKYDTNNLQEVASKQGGTVSMVDEDTFRANYLKSAKAIIQNKKDLHPDLQAALLKDYDAELNFDNEEPEDVEKAFLKMEDEFFAREVSPTDKARLSVKEKNFGGNPEALTSFENTVKIINAGDELDLSSNKEVLKQKISELERTLENTSKRGYLSSADFNPEQALIAPSVPFLREQLPDYASGMGRPLTANPKVSSEGTAESKGLESKDVYGLFNRYANPERKDLEKFNKDLLKKQDLGLLSFGNPAEKQLLVTSALTEKIALEKAKLAQIEGRVSSFTPKSTEQVLQDTKDKAKALAEGKPYVAKDSKDELSKQIELTQEEAKTYGGTYDAGEYIQQQQLDRAEKKAVTRDYYEKTYGRVPYNFDALFDAQSPEPKIVSRGGRDFIVDSKGEFKELTAKKVMTQEEISKENMFSFGLSNSSGVKLRDKNGNYVPQQIVQGSGVFVSGQISGDADAVKKHREAVKAKSQALNILKNEILPAFDRTGAKWSPKIAGELTPSLTKLRASIRPDVLGTGSQSDLELKTLIENTPDPTKLLSVRNMVGGEKANAENLVKLLETSLQAEAEDGGFTVKFADRKAPASQVAVAKINQQKQ